jgi:hypothetical protein
MYLRVGPLALPRYRTPDDQVMGHEYVGVVEEIGAEVENVRVGDFVVGSFVISDNTCEICRPSYQSLCVNGEFMAQTIGTQFDKPASPTPTERWFARRGNRNQPRTSSSRVATKRGTPTATIAKCRG